MALQARVITVTSGRDSSNINYEIYDDATPETVLASGSASANTLDDLKDHLRSRITEFQRIDTISKELLALEGTVIDLS